MACQNALTKTRREAFNLLLDSFLHIEGAAIGNVAIGPHGLLPLWGACRVEEALLSYQHIGARWWLAMPDLSL